MSILQELIEEGALAGWWDFRAWLPDDLSGNANDGSFTGSPRFNLEGLDFSSGNNSVNCGTGFNALQAVTVSCWFKIVEVGNLQWLYCKYENGTDNWGISITAGGNLSIYDDIDNAGAVLYSTAVSLNEWHHAAAVIATDKEQKLYLDGVLVGSGTAASDFWDSFAGSYYVGSRVTGSAFPFDGAIRDVEVFNRELDITEINTLMGETRDAFWPSVPVTLVEPIMSIDGNQTDLEAAYDMRPQGDQIIDASPNGNDGTIDGPSHGRTLLGDHLTFDGIDGVIPCGTGMNVPDDATWEAWIRTTGVSGTFIAKWNASGNQRAWSFGMSNGRVGLGVSSTGANFEIELDGSGVTINNGAPHHVVAVYDKSEDTVDFYVDGEFTEQDTFTTTTGGIFPTCTATVQCGDEFTGVIFGPYAGEISQLQLHQRKLTVDEILAKYEAGAAAIQYKSDWGTPISNAAVATGLLESTGWAVDSGTFIVSTDTIGGQRVKVIECVTAGVVYIDMLQFMNENEAAYGTWEVYVYKDDTAHDMDMVFIADSIGGLEAGTQDGYGFRYMNTDDGIYLYETVGGGLNELGHFIGLTPAEDWYLLHLDRRVSGMLDMWVIDDSGIGSALDTTTTTSRYICLEMDAGDKVAFADEQGDHCIVKKLGVV